MNKHIQVVALCILLLFLLSACSGGQGAVVASESASVSQDKSEAVSSQSQSQSQSMSSSMVVSSAGSLNSAKLPALGAAAEQKSGQVLFKNETEDMTFQILEDTCKPGQSVVLNGLLDEFTYSTAAFTMEQAFWNIRMPQNKIVNVVAENDPEKGYTLQMYSSETPNTPERQFLLLPEGLYWMETPLDYKLYVNSVSRYTNEELLTIYPKAVEMPVFQNFPEYTLMFWSYEPLYNVRISETYYLDYENDQPLFKYIDWDKAEKATVKPGEPLLTNIISVGSAWYLAMRFEDAQGNETIYVGGENGMGGDEAGILLAPLKGKILTKEETEAHYARNKK